MVEMKGIYQGAKRCELTHGPSQTKINTDAPKDNNGKGEAFSPTDLVGAALGSCIVTTMAIQAEKNNIPVDLKNTKFTVTKEMQSDPRRIKRLVVTLEMPPGIPADKRAFLEQIGHSCPVKLSLSKDVEVLEKFIWL